MRSILYLFLFICIASCTSNTIFKKPDDLIGEDKMVDLLTDLYLTTAAKTSKNTNGKRNIDYTFLVYEKHGIDSAQFRRSNYYYTTKIDDYEIIYERVKNRIEKLNKNFSSLKKERDSIIKDSIKQVKFIKDSLIKVTYTLDSIFLDSINKTIIDTTARYNLEKIKLFQNSGKLDSLRSVIKKNDSIKNAEILQEIDSLVTKKQN
jgi:hypothetical protein